MSTETLEQKSESKAMKAAKLAGKLALTAICPPIGLPTFFEKGQKGGAAFSGFVISFLSSAITLGLRDIDEKKLYDKPNVTIEYRQNDVTRAVGEVFFSPLAFYFDSHAATLVRQGETAQLLLSRARGEDIISFDEKTGLYHLNFNESTPFDTNNSGSYSSLAEAQRRYDELRKNGDVIALRSAGSDLAKVSGDYESVKSQFEMAVRKMNAELEASKK